MNELHRIHTDRWVTAMFGAVYALEDYDMAFDDSAHAAMEAECMEFGTGDNPPTYNGIDSRRALTSQERTIHWN